MGPLEAYIIGLALVAFPSSPFNRVAAVIVITWCGAYLAHKMGAPALWLGPVQHVVGAALCFRLGRGTSCFIVGALFVSMAAVDVIRLLHDAPDDLALWTLFSLAFAQLIAIPLGNDWSRIGAVLDCYRRTPDRGPQFMVSA